MVVISAFQKILSFYIYFSSKAGNYVPNCRTMNWSTIQITSLFFIFHLLFLLFANDDFNISFRATNIWQGELHRFICTRALEELLNEPRSSEVTQILSLDLDHLIRIRDNPVQGRMHGALLIFLPKHIGRSRSKLKILVFFFFKVGWKPTYINQEKVIYRNVK